MTPVLVSLALLAAPERYPHLPSEAACAAMHLACRDDLQFLNDQRVIAGTRTSMELRELRDEAERTEQIWYAVWWLQWRPPFGPLSAEQCKQWENRLLDLIGQRAFCRGDIPLPLSLR